MSTRAPLLLLIVAALGCAGARAGPTPGPAATASDPRAVLGAFVAALDGTRWEEAYALLDARWRARTTPARLPGDLAAAGAVGRDALARVRALLAAGAPLEISGSDARLPVGEGKAARLVREGEAWRVEALE